MGPRIYPSEQSTNAAADGTLILSFDDTLFNSSLSVTINGVQRPSIFRNTNGFSYYNLKQNDVVTLINSVGPAYRKVISVYRRDYTTDDQGGNNGIVDTLVTGFTTTGTTYTFTATTIPSAYHFEYRASWKLEVNGPTPTPTPTISPTPTPTSTSTPTPTPLPTMLPYGSKYQMFGIDVYGTSAEDNLYVSNNYGVSFTKALPTGIGLVESCSMSSATSKYQTAITNDFYGVGSRVYCSTNSGSTFTQNIFFGTGNTYHNTTITSDGKYHYISYEINGLPRDRTGVYRSSDSGTTYSIMWTGSSANIGKVLSSDDGQYIFLCGRSTTTSYRSTDYGSTFIPVTGVTGLSGVSGVLTSNSASMSRDGKYLIGNVYSTSGATTVAYTIQSSDYGATFTVVTGLTYYPFAGYTGETYSSAISSGGTYQAIAQNSFGYMYNSTNSGSTFTVVNTYGAFNPSNRPNQNYTSYAMNPNGKHRLTGAGAGVDAWYSSDYGVNWYIITSIPSGSEHTCIAMSDESLP